MPGEKEKKVTQCPVSEEFKKTIKNYLDDFAKKDPLFAESYTRETKNLDDCCRYIIGEVKASGRQGFADSEIYGMAIHYYDEVDITIKGVGNVRTIVNHEVQLSKEELEKAKQEAYNKVVQDNMNSLQKKPAHPSVEKKETLQQQLNLFD